MQILVVDFKTVLLSHHNKLENFPTEILAGELLLFYPKMKSTDKESFLPPNQGYPRKQLYIEDCSQEHQC